MSRVAPTSASTTSDGNGRRPPARVDRPRRRGPGRLVWAAGALLLLVALGVVVVLTRPAQQPPAAAVPTLRLVAHGTIEPVNQARVGTLSGGVLAEVGVRIGQSVSAQQELARMRGPNGLEQLTAPFSGTVTGILAHTGDTLVPGAGVLTIADLSRLQVETNDVDEFLIGHVRPGETVALTIEALDGRPVTGRIQSVALQPQTTAVGDLHYPVTIDLGGTAPDVRPGMSVRITLPD